MSLSPSHREIYLDCNYTFPIYLAPNGIQINRKSVITIQIWLDLRRFRTDFFWLYRMLKCHWKMSDMMLSFLLNQRESKCFKIFQFWFRSIVKSIIFRLINLTRWSKAIIYIYIYIILANLKYPHCIRYMILPALHVTCGTSFGRMILKPWIWNFLLQNMHLN